ncbi:OmpA family protein [Chitinibacteraceae bacterium HSL-7]
MTKRLIPLVLAVVVAATGCANMSDTQKGLGLGAVLGAAAGAGIGAATGSDHVGRDAAIGAAVGALGGYVWSQQMEKQRQEMEQATAGTGIDVTKTPNNELKLDVPADFSFDVGKYAIKPNMRPILDKLASTLNQNPVTIVRVVGHTDNTGTDAINNPLSVNRANAVRGELTRRGVAGNRMTTEGRGSYEPIADNSTVSGRAQNRRVEIYVAQPAQ